MRRTALALVLLALAAGLAAGCGGEEEVTPTPDTVTGTTDTTDTTETETTETETTETETTETETTETEPAGEGDAAAGKEVFLGTTAACGTCHTLADAGTSGTVGPNLDDSQPSFELVTDRVTNGAGAMPPFGDSLSAQQIADVSAYVSSVAGG